MKTTSASVEPGTVLFGTQKESPSAAIRVTFLGTVNSLPLSAEKSTHLTNGFSPLDRGPCQSQRLGPFAWAEAAKASAIANGKANPEAVQPPRKRCEVAENMFFFLTAKCRFCRPTT